jgi:hypothetical protein
MVQPNQPHPRDPMSPATNIITAIQRLLEDKARGRYSLTLV